MERPRFERWRMAVVGREEMGITREGRGIEGVPWRWREAIIAMEVRPGGMKEGRQSTLRETGHRCELLLQPRKKHVTSVGKSHSRARLHHRERRASRSSS